MEMADKPFRIATNCPDDFLLCSRVIVIRNVKKILGLC
jgi:hypothetical protein